MPIGVSVVWESLSGREVAVEALLRELQAHTLREPGCLLYHLHRLEPAGSFLLYEQYVDMAAVEAHHATAHYLRLVRGEAVALVRSRRIVRGELLAAGVSGHPAA